MTGKHAAPRSHRATRATRRLPSTRRVLLGTAALAAAGVVVAGGQGTYASWTDASTATAGGLTAGKLDLTVDGQQGTPSAYAKSGLTMTSMVPGESIAANLLLANAGNADFTWVPTVTTSSTGLGPALKVELYLGGTESGDDASYPRTEGCTGGTLLTSGTTSTRLNVGASATVCVKVSLPTSTGDAYQNATGGTVTVAINANQVIA